ncbi:uncharacterized protein Fot_00675 [Forsythia ovata]|uniref:Uncharacterized protein n=1 Tax=Forsythia ovata TaxID=205694 RepID=A0ABD1X2A1_9LAMI
MDSMRLAKDAVKNPVVAVKDTFLWYKEAVSLQIEAFLEEKLYGVAGCSMVCNYWDEDGDWLKDEEDAEREPQKAVKKLIHGSEVEMKLQEEMNMEEVIVGSAGKWKEKCRESVGVVELLECLEREAIMGEDEGKEATDYNRRAQIFDTSSRVFKALKETTSSKHDS